jgi:neutral ceramidase
MGIHLRAAHPSKIVLLVTWMMVSVAGQSSLAEDGWKAGTARANITPLETMWMAGYASRDRPAEGVSTELWAKALVLEDAAGERALLLTLDLVGIDRALSVSICDEVSKRYELKRSSIAICTSHTHSGPVVGRNLAPMHYALLPPAQQDLVDRYAASLRATLVDLAGKALSDLIPCDVQWGMGTATFAVNRRNNPQPEVPARRTAGALVGPFDHDVPVLALRAGNQWKAIVFGYACHATVLGWMQWSGDYPGHAQMELERRYPGCQAMFWAGCGADQNPVPRHTPELAEHYGRRLATAVEAVLMTTELISVAPNLKTSYAEIDLELADLPMAEELRRVVSDGNRYEQSRARMLLAQIDSGTPLSPTYPYPVSMWKLGQDLRWVILGGEVVVDYALRLKSELEGPVWVAAYANDVMAYIPSRRVLQEGGYEGASAMVYYGLPSSWAPSVEQAIVGEVKRQAE